MTLRRIGLALVVALTLVGLAQGSSAWVQLHVVVEIHAVPKDVAGLPSAPAGSALVGEGRLQAARRTATDSYRVQATRGRLELKHVDIGKEAASRVTLALGVTGFRLTTFADGSRVLIGAARVTGSDDPGCPEGSTGPLMLRDDPHGDAARLVLCPYVHEHYYEGRGVRVEIR